MARFATRGSLIVALVAAATIVPGHAATPLSGTLRPGGRVEWSGGPLTGSAPASRGTTCQLKVNCDDFSLDVELPAKAYKSPSKAMIELSLSPQANSQMRLIVTPPGETNYRVYGTTATLLAPAAGLWQIRVACTVCAESS